VRAFVTGGTGFLGRRVVAQLAERGDSVVALARTQVPVGPVPGPLLGAPPNIGELISASHGVTYWASDEKARRELGYTPRPLREGLALTVAAP
jgi:nucleoside-diphosphate-sugar epimerase